MTSIARRRWLKALAAAPVAVRWPALAAAPAGGQRLLVLVFLYGGNDAFNTWVPFTDSLYYKLRPTIAVPRDGVIPVTERHGFHRSLSALMPAWEAREVALVQGIGLPGATQQHYRDAEMAFTGAGDDEFYRDGWITRALSSSAASRGQGAVPLDALAFDTLDNREADPMGPFRGDKLAVVQVQYAQELLEKRRMADCVIDANTRGRARVPREPLAFAPLKTSFPGDPFGQAVKAAVEVAAMDKTLPVIHIALNGRDGDKHHSVDTHWDQLKYHGDALERLAAGLMALRAGLTEIGRWDETLVATYDEFGRSPVENPEHGTHHGHATVHVVMGGRVKGGLVGEAPPVERVFMVGGPAPTLDTRRLWTTVVERWWNGDASGLFAQRHKPLDILRA
jgi:uncharacterized protein (DUF1501 family)